MSSSNEKLTKEIVNKTLDDAFSQDNILGKLPKNARDLIINKLRLSIFYTPRIGIMGKSGAGKSSLVNAIVGKKVFEVGHAGGCTRQFQEKAYFIGDMKLIFIDLPGIAENTDYDIEYQELYKEQLKNLDIVLWVIKIDDRANQADEVFYKRMIQEFDYPKDRVLFVLSQVDKAEPRRGWNYTTYSPSSKQLRIIKENQTRVADLFKVHMDYVIPVSCDYDEEENRFYSYGLDKLVTYMITNMPEKSRSGFYKGVDENNRTEEAKKQAQYGFEEALKFVLTEIIEVVPFIPETIKKYVKNGAEEIVSLGKKVWNSIFG